MAVRRCTDTCERRGSLMGTLSEQPVTASKGDRLGHAPFTNRMPPTPSTTGRGGASSTLVDHLPRSGGRTSDCPMAGFLARSSPPRSDGEGVPPCARDPEDEGAVYCPRRSFNRTRAADFDDLTGRVSRPFRWLTRKVTTVSVSWLAANRKFAVGSSAKSGEAVQ